MTEQHIACPNCKNKILLDANSLLLGVSFNCNRCDAQIKISGESKEVVSQSIDEFKKIKANARKK
jgi:transcription initiation factor IIE alpha subunit